MFAERVHFNSAYRSSIVETAFWQVAGEEWDENEIDWVEKFRKRKWRLFSVQL